MRRRTFDLASTTGSVLITVLVRAGALMAAIVSGFMPSLTGPGFWHWRRTFADSRLLAAGRQA